MVAGVESACKEIADENGRLSKDKLCLGRPKFKEAVESGLRWFVLQQDCEVYWPGLIKLVEKALNTRAVEQQSEIEVMLAMHNAQTAALNMEQNPDWVEIEKAASYNLPPCASWIGVLSQYVRDNSGGMQGELLEELNVFSRAYRCSEAGSKRMLGSEFFKKLCSLNFGAAERFPFVQNACIKANLASPANKMTDGFCKLIQPSNLAILTSKDKRPLVEEAETVMTDARRLTKALGISDTAAVKSLGKVDVRCVLHLMKLGKVGEGKEFSKIGDIAQAINFNCGPSCLACMGKLHQHMFFVPQ